MPATSIYMSYFPPHPWNNNVTTSSGRETWVGIIPTSGDVAYHLADGLAWKCEDTEVTWGNGIGLLNREGRYILEKRYFRKERKWIDKVREKGCQMEHPAPTHTKCLDKLWLGPKKWNSLIRGIILSQLPEVFNKELLKFVLGLMHSGLGKWQLAWNHQQIIVSSSFLF